MRRITDDLSCGRCRQRRMIATKQPADVETGCAADGRTHLTRAPCWHDTCDHESLTKRSDESQKRNPGTWCESAPAGADRLGETRITAAPGTRSARWPSSLPHRRHG